MIVTEDGVVIRQQNKTLTKKGKRSIRSLASTVSYNRSSTITNKMIGIIMNLPNIVEFFINEDQLVADVPKAIADKIKSGEYTFLKSNEGSIKAQIRNTVDGQVVKTLDLKEVAKTPEISNLANMAATTALYNQLTLLENKIDKVNEGVLAVSRSLENDRVARVLSVQESLEQAFSVKDKTIRETILVDTLTESILAKNMIYKQMEEKIQSLLADDKKPKSKRMSADEGDKMVKEIIDSYYIYSEAFKVQLRCYFELKEYTAVSQAISMFYNQVKNVDSLEIRNELDGSLELDSHLFSKSMDELYLSLDKMEEYLYDNINLLDQSVYEKLDYAGRHFNE